jgi:hypothetical protein
MNRSVSLAGALLGIAGATFVIGAEETAVTAAAPARPRLVSPRVAQMLADVAAREPVAASTPIATTEPAAPQRVAGEIRDVPANGIVRLPDYIVREPRLPPREEVMSRRSLEQVAMQKYFGDETSLYRVLNMFSPVHVWLKIPVLGKFPFMIGQFSGPGSGRARGAYTNEDRAMELYEIDRTRERWENMMGLLPAEQRERLASPDRPGRGSRD